MFFADVVTDDAIFDAHSRVKHGCPRIKTDSHGYAPRAAAEDTAAVAEGEIRILSVNNRKPYYFRD